MELFFKEGMSSLFYIKYKGSTTSILIRIRNRGTYHHIWFE